MRRRGGLPLFWYALQRVCSRAVAIGRRRRDGSTMETSALAGIVVGAVVCVVCTCAMLLIVAFAAAALTVTLNGGRDGGALPIVVQQVPWAQGAIREGEF